MYDLSPNLAKNFQVYKFSDFIRPFAKVSQNSSKNFQECLQFLCTLKTLFHCLFELNMLGHKNSTKIDQNSLINKVS